MTDVWYSPSDIVYSRPQMMWGILYLDMLEIGDWPSENRDTGYTGSQGSRNTKTKFLPAALLYAEITARLKTTRDAGEALVDEIQSGVSDYEGLSRPAQRALNYISGWRRRSQSYSRWKTQRRYRVSKLDNPATNII